MESKSDISVTNIQNFLSLHYVVFKIASDVLRRMFYEKWETMFRQEWKNTEENGKAFIFGPGKYVFKDSKKIQKQLLKTGNVNVWDLPLIIESIQSLEYGNRDDPNYKNMKQLKEIRKLSHQPTTEVPNEKFEEYWNAVSEILVSFGVSQETLDEAKDIRFQQTEYAESHLSSENQTVDELNSIKANELKAKGNAYFAEKEYRRAIEVYSEAIELPGIPLKSLAILYSNRSLMYSELHEFPTSKEDAIGVIRILPTWWRGYARLAESYEKMKKFEKAVKNFELSLQMNPPDDHQAKLTDSLYYCRRMLGKENRREGIQPHTFITTTKDVVSEINKQLGTTKITEADIKISQLIVDNLDVSKSNPMAICAEGHRLLRGIDGQLDIDLAVSRFAKAANLGSADGMYNLGVLLLEGKGIKRNTQQGIDMFKQAAELPSLTLIGDKKLKNEGVSEAKHALGLAYYEGSGVSKNIKTAFTWWTRAVEEDGNENSANNIGHMLEYGELEPPNIEEAILYYKFAASDYSVRAMDNLFRVYWNMGKRNEAMNWYRLAVENGSIKDTEIDKYISARTFEKFDSKVFVEKLRNELKCGRFKRLVLQNEERTKILCDTIQSDLLTVMTPAMPKNNIESIVEHRTWFRQMKDTRTHMYTYVHPPKLKARQNVNIIGLKPIFFKDMIASVDKIYEGFALKVSIIEDAIVGQPSIRQPSSVNVIGQDDNGDVLRMFIYNIPQNKETQEVVGYGCKITIVNPYHRIGTRDERPGIRVDDPSTIIYHTRQTDKKRCRYCGKPQGTIACSKCKRVFYCSQNCLKKDGSENQHELVCVKSI